MIQGTKTMFSCQVREADLAQLKEVAAERGISVSDVARARLFAFAELDPEVRRMIEKYSERLHIDPALVIQNVFVAYMARRAAKVEVSGKETEILLEFSSTDRGPLPSAELFEMLKTKYVDELSRDRMPARTSAAALPKSDTNLKIERAEKARARGLVPEILGDDIEDQIFVGGLFLEFDRGEIDAAQLNKLLSGLATMAQTNREGGAAQWE